MTATIGAVEFGNDAPLSLIAGPCQMEGRSHALDTAGRLQEIAAACGIGFVYKTSFDKANRTSGTSKRGIGLTLAQAAFDEIRGLGAATITDVHEPWQCAEIAPHVDALQIPAFLCRQTDLLVAAAKTGLPVNVKKGQFVAPWDMMPIIGKLTDAGCRNILLTERGSSFGYNALVVDMRSLPIMAGTGRPVIFDATHSCQAPGGLGTSSGGDRRYVPALARAAVAAGVAGLFVECHENPDEAPSDGPVMMRLADMPALINEVMEIDAVVKRRRAA